MVDLRAFDPVQAVRYGSFVDVAYRMYAATPADPKPTPLPLPGGYVFVAWVQMKDFTLNSGTWSFYGVLAQDPAEPSRFVLAIRGTSDPVEWWDDLTAMVPAPWVGAGLVGYGFNRIYQTLRLVERDEGTALSARAPLNEDSGIGFALQVAAAVHRHAAVRSDGPVAAQALTPTASRSIDVTGHSLGSALAMLYVAENASRQDMPAGAVSTPVLCTFASPRVGDAAFAESFDGLGVSSWRVVNDLDVVPKLPAIGFVHVDRLQEYNSGRLVHWSLTCWHALSTYLHLIDPKQPLGAGCAWSQSARPAASLMSTLPPAIQTERPPAAIAPEGVALSPAEDTRAAIEITIKVR